MIIGLSGYAQVGKDTFAKSLILRHNFVRVSFADKLKAVAYGSNPWVKWKEEAGKGKFIKLRDAVKLNGWEYVKNNSDAREFLQLLGTEGVRDNLGPMVWVEACSGEVMDAVESGKNVIFTDMRYPNEYDYVRALGGFTVRVERPGVEAVNEHASDSALKGKTFDALVLNNAGLQGLAQKATTLYDLLVSRQEGPTL